MSFQDRLGSFYLGAPCDVDSRKRLPEHLLYDSRDLTTHAVCIGVTGSGKTGLCVGLLEEAALDNIPAIIVDPKGDMTNLLLQFPECNPGDFLPWIDPDDARRKQLSPEDYANRTAETWKTGLADWGITSERMKRLASSADYTIFTPGSEAGMPVSILGSLAAPDLEFATHAETIRERISGTVTALLGLAGEKSDDPRSRASILLASILEYFWRNHEDVSLEQLIHSIQDPPVRQIGVFDIDTFFPRQERFRLAMAFNNLMASPGFQAWLTGEPLDIDSMLFSAEGKPRQSIFYLAHLPDADRMFFMTLLLENVITWMRSQSGTTSLRAIVYIDEMFGFLPPVAEPPSKRPLLTLLKQSRAFGIGCVLVTQNPVDLDYKALTNTGTWFIGKLQTEQDKARVLEGLQSSRSGNGPEGKPADYNRLISSLSSRTFLMHNVHASQPVLFQTRWAMSYLRGPLTRIQVHELVHGQHPPESAETMPLSSQSSSPAPTRTAMCPEGYSQKPPSAGSAVDIRYLPLLLSDELVAAKLSEKTGKPFVADELALLYEPALKGDADVYVTDRKRDIQQHIPVSLLLSPGRDERRPDWKKAIPIPPAISSEDQPEAPGAGKFSGPWFSMLPDAFNTAKEITAMKRKLEDWLYYTTRLSINVHHGLDLFQHPEEPYRTFLIRLHQKAREQRDIDIDAIEERYGKRIEKLEQAIGKEERELAADETEYQARKQHELAGLGETVLGFFLGRRSTRGISSALTKRRMTARARAEIEESQQTIEELQHERESLEEELEKEIAVIAERWEHPEKDLITEELAPRRTDIDVRNVELVLVPLWLAKRGQEEFRINGFQTDGFSR